MSPSFLLAPPIVSASALYRRQVEEAYRPLRQSAAFSLVGAVLTFFVLSNSGDTVRGLYWFTLATSIFAFRLYIASKYERTGRAEDDPSRWETLLILGNFFAGIQWCLLGTVLFESSDHFRQLFIVLLIVSYVAGALVPFTVLTKAYFALAVPAALPTIIYSFFVATGTHWLPGVMALILMGFMTSFAFSVHKTVIERLRLELQNKALLEQFAAHSEELGSVNADLKRQSDAVVRAEKEARLEADALSSHVEQTLLPVITCSPEFRIVDWNDAAHKLLGYRAEEVVGDNLGELLFPEERRGNIKPYLAKLFADRQPSMIEFPAVARDGEHIPMRYYVTPIVGTNGVPRRISVILIETYADPSLTPRRRAPDAA